MKTNPTPQVTGAAGTPLSHAAIEFGRKFSAPGVAKNKRPETISDTLETSDRDGDERQPLTASQPEPPMQIESTPRRNPPEIILI